MSNKLEIKLSDTKAVPIVYLNGEKLDHIIHLDINWDTDTTIKKLTNWSVSYADEGDEIIKTVGEYYE